MENYGRPSMFCRNLILPHSIIQETTKHCCLTEKTISTIFQGWNQPLPWWIYISSISFLYIHGGTYIYNMELHGDLNNAIALCSFSCKNKNSESSIEGSFHTFFSFLFNILNHVYVFYKFSCLIVGTATTETLLRLLHMLMHT